VECRLDVSPEPGRAVVRVHGRLAEGAVQELQRVCREATGALVLDVTYLLSADDMGLATLRGLATDGAHLVGVSPYLALLLEDDRSESGASAE
jgi:hypothetical protein